MNSIIKSPETMTSKERVLRTFSYEKTDRVPIDYSANPGIHSRLCQSFGLTGSAAAQNEALLDILGVDFRPIDAVYKGKNLFPVLKDRKTDPVYGFNMRWVTHESGGYWDFCDFPLKDVDDEIIANFPLPTPDDFSVEHIKQQIKTFSDKAIYIGHPGIADIINSTGRLMSMEDTLVNLYMEDEATLTYVDRAIDLQLSILEKLLEEARDSIDFLWMGEDLGTQHSPMISLEMYRRVLKPRHQKYIDLANAYQKPIMVHTCGSSSWVYEEFIEMGICAVDTLQPEAANMSPQYLKEHFGNRLSMHGCISTAGPLAYGTTSDVEKNVKETLEIMMPGGGYHLAPTHMIQDNSPVENVIAMYRAAHIYGKY